MRIDTTAEERTSFAAQVRVTLVERLRWVVVPGILVCAAVGVVAQRVYALDASAWVPPAVAATLLALAGLATLVPALARWPHALYAVLSIGFSAAIAELAARTGGFSSPFVYCLLLVWVFGSALSGLGPRALQVFIVLQTGTLIAWVLARGAGGSPWMPIVIGGGSMVFCVMGAWLRDRADLSLHVANARLAVKIEAQVAESHALDAQLRVRVRERARELAMALDQLAASRARPLEPGDVIDGRAEVIRVLGEGAMGVVYACHDRVTARPVAVKVLHHGVSPDAMRRFVIEAAACASIEAVGIVRTIHVDVASNGRLYHVMELVEGATLQQVLAKVPLAPEEAARVVGAIARALAAAHDRGIVHRDVKPGNVMVTVSAPGIRILDFGLSKLLDETWHDGVATRTRGVLGTPRYMAPEQRAGLEIGPAADVYALGIVLEEAMTGRSHEGAGDAPTPQVLVSELLSVLARCLAVDAAARPAAEELATLLDAYARDHGAVDAPTLAARALARLPA